MTDFINEDPRSDTLTSGKDHPRKRLLPEEPQEGTLRVVSARGTEEGLVLRIDGRAEWREIIEELVLFLGQRRRFLEGGEVAIEWLDRLPTKEQSQELEILLREEYDIEIIGRKGKTPRRAAKERTDKLASVMRLAPEAGNPSQVGDRAEQLEQENAPGGNRRERSVPLAFFDDIDGGELWSERSGKSGSSSDSSRERGKQSLASSGSIEVSKIGTEMDARELDKYQLRRVNELLGEDAFIEDDANARIIFGTLRSGQRIESPFSLVIVGDVNPGADVIAGGDIIVLGSLRGTAHASAYDDDCQDRVIVALQMQPMQLRIGSVISRGNGEAVRGAEIARIEDRRIIVETFNSRVMGMKRFR